MSPAPRAALERAVAALGVEPVELPSGAGHDAAILALAGVPSAMLFVRSDAGRRQPRAGGAHRRRRRRARPCRRSRPRCASWRPHDRLGRARAAVAARPRALRPGHEPGRAAGRARPGRARAAATGTRIASSRRGTCSRPPPPRCSTPRSTPSACSPTSATGLARLARRAAGVRDARARRAGADLGRSRRSSSARARPSSCRSLTYGLYAAVCRRPAASSRACPPAGLAIDLDAVADAADRDGRPAGLDLRSEQPDGHADRAARPGTPSSTACRPDCIVVADEAYIDFAEPGAARRPAGATCVDGRAGDRHPLVLEDLRPRRPARWATRSPIPRSRGCSTSCRSRSTSTASRSPPGIAGVADPAFVERAARRGRRARASAAARRARRPPASPALPSHVELRARRARASTTSPCAPRCMRRGILMRGGTRVRPAGLRARDGRAARPVMRRAAAEIADALGRMLR